MEKKPPLEKSYKYFSVGAGPLPIPSPTLSIGFRDIQDDTATDFGVSFTSIIGASALYAHCNALKYSAKKHLSNAYTGLGLSGGVLIDEFYVCGAFFSPQIILGKEFVSKTRRRQFLEASIKFPLLLLSTDYMFIFPLPAITVQYGVAF